MDMVSLPARCCRSLPFHDAAVWLIIAAIRAERSILWSTISVSRTKCEFAARFDGPLCRLAKESR